MGLMLYRKNRNPETVFNRDPFWGLSRDMNRFFEDFFQPAQWPQAASALANRESVDWVPRVNFSETETQYKVTAEVPGLEKENLDVSIRDNSLVLRGERHATHEDKDGEVKHREIYHGTFERVIGFAQEVNPEKVQASFKNGMLVVTVDKAVNETARPRKVTIE